MSQKSKKKSFILPTLTVLALIGLAAAVLVLQRNTETSNALNEFKKLLPMSGGNESAPTTDKDTRPTLSTPAEDQWDMVPDATARTPWQGSENSASPQLLTYAEFVNQPELWPQVLSLSQAFKLETRYNGKVHGEAEFHVGTRLDVDKLLINGYIQGKLLSLSLLLPQNNTNLTAWFEAFHGNRFSLIGLPEDPASEQTDTAEVFDRRVYNIKFERWCLANTSAQELRLDPDVIRAYIKRGKDATQVHFDSTATLIAQVYLTQQRADGGDDNFVTCEVLDHETHEVLARGSYLLP